VLQSNCSRSAVAPSSPLKQFHLKKASRRILGPSLGLLPPLHRKVVSLPQSPLWLVRRKRIPRREARSRLRNFRKPCLMMRRNPKSTLHRLLPRAKIRDLKVIKYN
jgi:hypothetical protein